MLVALLALEPGWDKGKREGIQDEKSAKKMDDMLLSIITLHVIFSRVKKHFELKCINDCLRNVQKLLLKDMMDELQLNPNEEVKRISDTMQQNFGFRMVAICWIFPFM